MKTIPVALQTHFGQDATTLAICWMITKNNGVVIRGTEHDWDVVITSGTYAGTYLAGANVSGSDLKSTSTLDVDNMEVDGAFPDEDSAVVDLTVDDIEANLLDNALVTVFVVNWARPQDGVMVARTGNLGNLERDSDGKYRTEIRGLSQRLSQQIGNTYGQHCNVKRFGDTRCGFDVEALRMYGATNTVTSRRRFDVVIGSPFPTYVYPLGGEVTFTTGLNAGYTRQVKRIRLLVYYLDIELWEAFPNDISEGDSLTVIPGCDRLIETCKFVYDNIENFRGPGVFIPGMLQMMAGPDGASQVVLIGNGLDANGNPRSLARMTSGAYTDAVTGAGGNGIPTNPPITSPTSGIPPIIPPAGGGAGNAVAGSMLTGPRIGITTIGNDRDYNNPDFIEAAKWCDLVVIGIWRGWEDGNGPANIHTDALLSQGLIGKTIWSYYNTYELDRAYNINGGADQAFAQKCDAMTWWGYVRGSSGEIAYSGWETAQQVNLSRFAPRDSNGKSPIEWTADRAYSYLIGGGVVDGSTIAPNPNLSGIAHDLIYYQPRGDWDINRDGVTDERSSEFARQEVQWIFSEQIRYWRTIAPNQLHGGNTADFWAPGREVPAAYQGMLDGGYLEGGMGEDWSIERWGTFADWLSGYRKQMAMFRQPTYAVHTCKLPSPWKNRTQFDSADWRFVRYAACATWTMGDAAVYLYGDGYGWKSILEFDEWDGGGANYKYLGAPVDGPALEPWQSGCYRRRWQHGWTIVNPKGNGARTLQLGTTMTRLAGRSGYGDTSVNSGASVTEVTLQERDGIVLLGEYETPASAAVLSTEFAGLSWADVVDFGASKDYRLNGTDSATGQVFGVTSPELWGSSWGPASLTLQLITGTGRYPSVTPDMLFTRSFATVNGMTCLGIARNYDPYVGVDQAAFRLKTAADFSDQSMVVVRGMMKVPAGITPAVADGAFVISETKFNYGDKKIQIGCSLESGVWYWKAQVVRSGSGAEPWGNSGGPYVNSDPLQDSYFYSSDSANFFRTTSDPRGKWITYIMAFRPRDGGGAVAGGAADGWFYVALGLGTTTTPVAFSACTQEFYIPGINMADIAAPGATIIFPFNHYMDFNCAGMPFYWTNVEIYQGEWPVDSPGGLPPGAV